MTLRTILPVVAMFSALSGCATVASVATFPGRLVQSLTTVSEQVDKNFAAAHALKARERQILLDELNAEREALVEEAQADLDETQRNNAYRKAALRGDAERTKDDHAAAFKEEVRTKLGLHVDQGFTLGQPEVDTERLKRLMAERQKTAELREALHEQNMADWRRRQFGQTEALTSPDGTSKSACPYGTSADWCTNIAPPVCVPNNCAQPRHLPLEEAPPKAPLQQPLQVTDIPIVLPLTLGVSMQQPRIEESAPRRLPLKAPCRPCQAAPQPDCKTKKQCWFSRWFRPHCTSDDPSCTSNKQSCTSDSQSCTPDKKSAMLDGEKSDTTLLVQPPPAPAAIAEDSTIQRLSKE